MNLSASTVRRVTEAVGAEVAVRRAAGETLGPGTPWEWHRDARGQRVAYVGLDATAVPQQGPHGKKAEGECAAVGIAHADVVLGLTDGGHGLETCLVETVLSGLAREVVLILDFFHATEHVREFAKV